jgi:hypothetical protein
LPREPSISGELEVVSPAFVLRRDGGAENADSAKTPIRIVRTISVDKARVPPDKKRRCKVSLIVFLQLVPYPQKADKTAPRR